MTTPETHLARSFVYRELVARKANFEALGQGLGECALAMDFGDPAGEAATVRRLGLADLSPLPRLGLKGAGTADWLTAQGLQLPAESNQAVRQASGILAARLAPAELLLLGDLSGAAAPLDALAEAWQGGTQPPNPPRGYLLPRRHSHFWFLVSGEESARMFAKLCGVDLRPEKFAAGAIAQTSMARMNAVIVREDQGGVLAYHVLGDSASAAYLWGCLLDAMAEFDGAPVGLAALRNLSGS